MPAQPLARPITSGPHYHWFGYYDKLQVAPTGRFALGMEVAFEHRSPVAEDQISLGIVDMEDGDSWRHIGSTQAWCWQQGCMLQWIPGSDREIIYNDRDDGRFVSRIVDVTTGGTRTLPKPVYTLSPDGRTAVGTDFRRINHTRPGYGYAGIPDPNREVNAPDDVGIYSLDLETGTTRLILSLAEAAAIPYPHGDISGARHWFNHLLFSTDGSRFIFLHRWRLPDIPGFKTRMMTAAPDGSDLHVVDDFGRMSHFIWRDAETILGWSWHPDHGDHFYLHHDRSDAAPEVVGKEVMTADGHCTYLPGGAWILCDAYPAGDPRHQPLYLYQVTSGRRLELGAFPAPAQYTGEWRCDLHPRSSPDGRFVLIDSAHAGDGRQIYRIDVDDITDILEDSA